MSIIYREQENPLVSVIIPYNKDRGYLAQCVASINAQTYPNIELIHAFSPESVGYNFNQGLEKATGEFVKWVDEDDWLPPNSIEYLVNGISYHPWVCANAWHVDDTTEVVKSVWVSFEDTLRLCGIHGGTVLFRTELLKDIGGMDESLLVGEEWDMYLRLMLNGYLPTYIDKEVVYYRRWDGSKSVADHRNRRTWRKKQISNIRARYES